MPRCLVANLKSSAALSKSSTSFFLLKLLRCSKHCSRCCLWRSLVIKISSLVKNLFFKLFFIFKINSSIFKFSLIEINTWFYFFISGSISPFKRSDLFITKIAFWSNNPFKTPVKSRFLTSTTTNFKSASSALLNDNLIPFFSISFLDSLIPAVSETITG